MSKLLNFFHGIFYMEQETIMTPEQKNYYAAVNDRNNLIQATRVAIETRIERFCRVCDEIIVDDLGFELLSVHNYPESWQQNVVKGLEKLGYKCTLNFSYEKGFPQAQLKVSWA